MTTSSLEPERFSLDGIPALFWGSDAFDKIVVGAHGALSSKSDEPWKILASEAVERGFRVLTFDLPESGERRESVERLEPRTCVAELRRVVAFARRQAASVWFAGVSLGAYFGLAAFDGESDAFERALLLSPILDMERLVLDAARRFDVSLARLEAEQTIELPNGQTLSWDYYRAVVERRIRDWRVPTSILRGERDALCGRDVAEAFAKRFACRLETSENSEHYFHTADDMRIYRDWIRRNFDAPSDAV